MNIAAAMVTGILSSVGPCAAPRYLTLVSLLTRARDGAWVGAFTYLVGLFLGSMFIVLSSAVVVGITRWSSSIYLLLAASMGVYGCWMLFERSHDVCNREERRDVPSGAFVLLGGASAFVVSPCCTPILIALGATTASDPAQSIFAAAAFIIGHVGAIAAVGVATHRLRTIGLAAGYGTFARTVCAGLTIALSGYYLVLA